MRLPKLTASIRQRYGAVDVDAAFAAARAVLRNDERDRAALRSVALCYRGAANRELLGIEDANERGNSDGGDGGEVYLCDEAIVTIGGVQLTAALRWVRSGSNNGGSSGSEELARRIRSRGRSHTRSRSRSRSQSWSGGAAAAATTTAASAVAETTLVGLGGVAGGALLSAAVAAVWGYCWAATPEESRTLLRVALTLLTCALAIGTPLLLQRRRQQQQQQQQQQQRLRGAAATAAVAATVTATAAAAAAAVPPPRGKGTARFVIDLTLEVRSSSAIAAARDCTLARAREDLLEDEESVGVVVGTPIPPNGNGAAIAMQREEKRDEVRTSLSAVPAAQTVTPKAAHNFTGTWHLDHVLSDDQGDYLAAMGVPWLVRKALASSSRLLRLEHTPSAVAQTQAQAVGATGSGGDAAHLARVPPSAGGEGSDGGRGTPWVEQVTTLVITKTTTLTVDGGESTDTSPLDQSVIRYRTTTQEGGTCIATRTVFDGVVGQKQHTRRWLEWSSAGGGPPRAGGDAVRGGGRNGRVGDGAADLYHVRNELTLATGASLVANVYYRRDESELESGANDF